MQPSSGASSGFSARPKCSSATLSGPAAELPALCSDGAIAQVLRAWHMAAFCASETSAPCAGGSPTQTAVLSRNRSVRSCIIADSLHGPPGLERGGEGAVVEIVELAADGDAVGEARDRHVRAGQAVCDVVGRGLAVDGGAGREDHLLDARLGGAAQEARDVQLLRADAVEGGEGAAEHVIAALVGGGALERPEIGDIGHHAESRS